MLTDRNSVLVGAQWRNEAKMKKRPDASARFDRVGGGYRDKQKGCSHLWRKVNFPNSQWLNGDKSVITLTTADHDCVQVRFAACNSCYHWRMPWLVILLREFQHFFAQIWTKRGHLLWSKDVVILLTEFEESLTYQLYATAKEMQFANIKTKARDKRS